MGKRWVLACAFAMLLGLFGVAAVAGTGGRMGGGSWGGGSHSSFSSHSYSSGTSGFTSHSYSSSGGLFDDDDFGTNHSYNSYGYSPSSSSGSSGTLGFLLFGVGAIVIVGFFMFSSFASRSSPSYDTFYDDAPVRVDGADVSVLRIVVDGRARKLVQSELARIAKIADTATPEGRQTMLREVSLMLRRLRDAWIYGGAVNEPMTDMAGAKATFDRHVDDARSRFEEETITNEQGKVTQGEASHYVPRSDEGAGVILVSIILAARRELFTVQQIGSGDDLRHALESATHLGVEELIALEIVWQPSEDADRLTSIELEAKYPRPDLIPIKGALVGKVFCSYCGGPFPAELVTCPHCGAPAPGRDAPGPQAAPAKAA